MSMTIAEFAAQRGVSVQRARELARTGAVPARKEGGHWVILGTPQPRSRRRLADHTQQDLLRYLRTRTLDHVTGMRKKRLADIVVQLKNSGEPAALLRDYFPDDVSDLHPADGALVLASKRGMDSEVKLAIRHQPRVHILDKHTYGRRLVDTRMLKQQTINELAEDSGFTVSDLHRIERGNYPLDQLSARKLAHAAGMKVSRMEIRSDD